MLLAAFLAIWLSTSAAFAATGAELTAPLTGSELQGSTQTFTWTAGDGLEGYYLYVGRPEQSDAYFSGALTATSQVVTGLPMDGSLIRVWLYSRANGQYPASLLRMYDLRAAVQIAEVIQPAANAALAGRTVTFSWTPGSGVDSYWVYVGTSANSSAYYTGQLSARELTLTNLPQNGSEVRLWLYSRIAGQYRGPRQYTFRAYLPESEPAQITAPTPGQALPGASVTFQWNEGRAVDSYWLYVGTPEQPTLYFNSQLSQRTVTVNNIPTDGRQIRTRLYSRLPTGSWAERIFDFHAALGLPPFLSTLEQGVAKISVEVQTERSVLAGLGRTYPEGYLAGLATLQWTLGRVSISLHQWRKERGLPLAFGGNAEDIARVTLPLEAGICGNSEAVFEALMARMGHQVRKVDIFYPEGTHTLNEVFYANQWRAFDPTWGTFWRRPGAQAWDLMSVEDISREQVPEDHAIRSKSFLRLQIAEDVFPDEPSRTFYRQPTVSVRLIDGTVLFER